MEIIDPNWAKTASGLIYLSFKENLTKTTEIINLDVSDGWLDLIVDALNDLNELQDPDLQIVQIKQKFAGLRIYVNKSSEEINEIIANAEKLAAKTCENCGSNDLTVCIRGNKWMKRLCKECGETHTF